MNDIIRIVWNYDGFELVDNSDCDACQKRLKKNKEE